MGFLPESLTTIAAVLAGIALAVGYAQWVVLRRRGYSRPKAVAGAVAVGFALLILGALITPYVVSAIEL